MSKVVGAAAAALGLTLVLSAPALAGISGPGQDKGPSLGNSNAQPGQQNCLGKALIGFAKSEGGLRVGQIAQALDTTGAGIIQPFIADFRQIAAEGRCIP